MERQSHQAHTQASLPRFDYLNQLVYLASATSAALSIATSLFLGNATIAFAGVGSAATSLLVLAPTRDRAARTAATLIVSQDESCDRRIADAATQTQSQINALVHERDKLNRDRADLTQKFAKATTELDHRQLAIDALKIEISRLQTEHRRVEQTLVNALKQAQTALDRAQERLNQKDYELSVHLEAIEIQILDVWNPLINGLVAICDRYDPSRPVPDLEYAGKPVTLDENEKKQWKHYRDSLLAYDAKLRQRVQRMSEECGSHDQAYGFFLRLLEELTISYCKLWAGIKDLELVTVHEGEKRAIYSEFESFREGYVSEASDWLEKADRVEAGFGFIEQSFKQELASLQQRIVDAEHLIEQLQAPRKFRGETSIDRIGNRLIEHFAESNVILDAIESVKTPNGFQLRFKVDRNPDSTKLAESEFDKHCEQLGLWGLSQRPLDFVLDTRNFLLSVDLFGLPDSGKLRSATVGNAARSTTAIAAKADTPDPAQIAARFQELECFSAAEFEEVVKLKFVPRVRVVAGSTGGKSPLLELITCAIARIHGGQIWLINPIPGSAKDWFHLPGVVPPSSDGIQAAIEWLGKAHTEFKVRRDDLPGCAEKPFITIAVDELNAIARDYADLGTVLKDFYQLSDHTRMGFLSAGQGGNVSGVSGRSQANRKTGNASKLMEEDFQNAVQVFTAAAAKAWIEKHLKGAQMAMFLNRLTALNQLCEELNQAEGKSAYPSDPTSKKVSPDAYRIALVVSPRSVDPFFIQLPPYSSYHGQMAGVIYPEGAIVTAPEANQKALALNQQSAAFTCPHCGCHNKRRKGTYTNGDTKYVCSRCSRVPS